MLFARALLRPWRCATSCWRSAAKGIVMRNGAGRVKHLDIKSLWVQEREAQGDLSVRKIPRLENWADLLTHHWTEQEGLKHLEGMGVQRRSRPRSLPLSAPPRGGVRVSTPWPEYECSSGQRHASVGSEGGIGWNDVQASPTHYSSEDYKPLLHLAQGAFGLGIISPPR